MNGIKKIRLVASGLRLPEETPSKWEAVTAVEVERGEQVQLVFHSLRGVPVALFLSAEDALALLTTLGELFVNERLS